MHLRAKALLCAATCLAALLTAATFAGAVDQFPKDGCTSPEVYGGAITSQSFTPAIGGTAAQVRFQGWFEVESVAPESHDTTYVEYSVDPQPGVPRDWLPLGTLIDQAEVAPTSGAPDQPYSNKGTNVRPGYQAFAFDLPAAQNPIQVRIRFNTEDTIFQGFRGVAVDRIELDAAGGDLVESFEDASVTWAFDSQGSAGAPFWQIIAESQNVTVKSPEVNPELVTLSDPGVLPATEFGASFAWFGHVDSGTFCGPDFANRTPPPDTTAPETTITDAPPGSTPSSEANFSFTSSEDGSSFECQLDGAGFGPCGSPQSYSGLTDGGHSFEVRATDPFGNVDPTPAVHTWTVRPATLADLPNPELGVDVNAEAVAGTVLVGIPGTAARSAGAGRGRASQKGVTFVPLAEARQVPVGSFFDTRRGTVRLQSARDRAGTRQTGSFFNSLFQVRQSRKRSARGLTNLVLKGSSFRRCRTASGKGASAAQLSRRTVRRLRANARGRFRTQGRNSAATVRGTIWDTVDRCDGTLTRVRRGRVVVRDFRRKRNVLLRAGKSYFARAPG
jgi:hypothetical protein